MNRWAKYAMRMMCVILASAVLSGGCEALGWGGYVLHGGETETVAAEFDGLEKSSVAVIVYCDESIQVKYPEESFRLSSMCAGHLINNVPGIKVRDPKVVGRFMHETLNWDTVPKNEICDTLDVDYLILIALEEFSTRGSSGSGSFQSRIVGEVKVYPRHGGDDDHPEWASRDSIRVVYPEGGATFKEADQTQHLKIAESKFGSKVAKLFYDHERPLKSKRGDK